jgi:hypothetical protein
LLALLMSASAWGAADDAADGDLQRKYLAILRTGVDFFEPIFAESLTNNFD